FWVLASSRFVSWLGEPAVLTVFHDITEQILAEASLKASQRRLVAQSAALMRMTTRYITPGERFDDRLRSILQIASRALNVERLSLWRFGPDGVLRCVGLHRATGSVFESGGALNPADAPEYFEALERDRVIAAPDARSDPRTRGFVDDYLIPNG